MNGNEHDRFEYDDSRNYHDQSFDFNGEDSLYPAKWDLSGLFPPTPDEDPSEPSPTGGQAETLHFVEGDSGSTHGNSLRYMPAPMFFNRHSNN